MTGQALEPSSLVVEDTMGQALQVMARSQRVKIGRALEPSLVVRAFIGRVLETLPAVGKSVGRALESLPVQKSTGRVLQSFARC